eukprot:11729512-Prorocentrum_lima.AAC.1
MSALKGFLVGIGDCKNAFYQSPLPSSLDPIFVEPVPEAGLSPSKVWKCLKAFQGLKAPPTTWSSFATT